MKLLKSISKTIRPDKAFLFFDALEEIAEYEGFSSMSKNEQAILIIVSELKCYPEVMYDKECPDCIREEMSISQFALGEMLDLLWDHPWSEPIDIIDDFVLKCHLYKTTSVLSDQKRVFSISEKTALTLIKKLKENEI